MDVKDLKQRDGRGDWEAGTGVPLAGLGKCCRDCPFRLCPNSSYHLQRAVYLTKSLSLVWVVVSQLLWPGGLAAAMWLGVAAPPLAISRFHPTKCSTVTDCRRRCFRERKPRAPCSPSDRFVEFSLADSSPTHPKHWQF